MDINDAWKSTCKSIFGKEIGELKKYEKYLKEAVPGMEVESSFSGKKMFAAAEDYAKGSKFYDYQGETAEIEKLNTPFDINEIKDIDSLIGQARERFVYSSNKVLGNSANVHNSDIVIDSMNVFDSNNIARCKNIKYGFWVRDSENIFGGASFGFGTNVVHSYYNKNLTRAFECTVSEYLSDSLFCYNTFNSSDCMFCFNLRNKHNMIANIQLAKEQYVGLKKGLMEQITDELEHKGRLGFSMLDLFG